MDKPLNAKRPARGCSSVVRAPRARLQRGAWTRASRKQLRGDQGKEKNQKTVQTIKRTFVHCPSLRVSAIFRSMLCFAYALRLLGGIVIHKAFATLQPLSLSLYHRRKFPADGTLLWYHGGFTCFLKWWSADGNWGCCSEPQEILFFIFFSFRVFFFWWLESRKEWRVLLGKVGTAALITHSRYWWLGIRVLARAAFFSASSLILFTTLLLPLVQYSLSLFPVTIFFCSVIY